MEEVQQAKQFQSEALLKKTNKQKTPQSKKGQIKTHEL